MSSKLGKAISVDPALMKKLSALRKAQQAGEGIENVKPADTPAIRSTEEIYLKEKYEHDTTLPNRKLFSEVFWKPASVPDFPVPMYDADYWDESIRTRIPAVDPTYYLDNRSVEQVGFAMFGGGTILLHGPTGTGKTSIIEQIMAYCNVPFLRVSCHGQMENSAFTGANAVVNQGGVPITLHSDTDTTLAAKHGGCLVFDEVFRTPSEALMSCQALLEYPHSLNLQDSHGTARQLAPPANDFWLMLTDNTTGVGDISGNFTAEVQDTSTRNRIRRAIYMDYLKPKVEIQLLQKKYPETPKSFLEDMIKVANLIRDAFMKGSIMETMSIRELQTWAKDFDYLRNIDLAFMFGTFSKLTPDDKIIVRDIYQQVFDRKLK